MYDVSHLSICSCNLLSKGIWVSKTASVCEMKIWIFKEAELKEALRESIGIAALQPVLILLGAPIFKGEKWIFSRARQAKIYSHGIWCCISQMLGLLTFSIQCTHAVLRKPKRRHCAHAWHPIRDLTLSFLWRKSEEYCNEFNLA